MQFNTELKYIHMEIYNVKNDSELTSIEALHHNSQFAYFKV